jgi:hypothetical protein
LRTKSYLPCVLHAVPHHTHTIILISAPLVNPEIGHDFSFSPQRKIQGRFLPYPLPFIVSVSSNQNMAHRDREQNASRMRTSATSQQLPTVSRVNARAKYHGRTLETSPGQSWEQRLAASIIKR